MALLDDDQQRRAIEAMEEYLSAVEGGSEQSLVGFYVDFDARREKLIEEKLKPLVESFLGGGVPLAEFRSVVDSTNKRHELWGFKGIKGQMFFDMLLNTCDDRSGRDQELRTAIGPGNATGTSSIHPEMRRTRAVRLRPPQGKREVTRHGDEHDGVASQRRESSTHPKTQA